MCGRMVRFVAHAVGLDDWCACVMIRCVVHMPTMLNRAICSGPCVLVVCGCELSCGPSSWKQLNYTTPYIAVNLVSEILFVARRQSYAFWHSPHSHICAQRLFTTKCETTYSTHTHCEGFFSARKTDSLSYGRYGEDLQIMSQEKRKIRKIRVMRSRCAIMLCRPQ